MAADNRDWHRAWWRKKQGYVERAAFRVSEKDRQNQIHRTAWRAVFLKFGFFLLFVFLLLLFKNI